MNRAADRSVKPALRSQKPLRTQPQPSVQKKRRDAPRGSTETQSGPRGANTEVKPAGPQQGKRPGNVSSSGAADCQRSTPGAQRKLSDASNASEDLSKDSGCVAGKLSSSDSSSETSDCPSEGNKLDSPSSDRELSWIDGGAYEKPNQCAAAAAGTCAPPPGAAGAGLRLFNSTGTFMELMMAETTEDLVRELDDLRSENEYLKDEVEELRCEVLEMRDMFQEEELVQLQELRLQLDQANKTSRVLQYRLRKAERRSIRVAQTGHVDGELVRSLEHDIRVAKSVSLRLYNELEEVKKKNSQFEWENEMLREKTQEQEVAKQVLQAEVEKTRETSVKKRSFRSSAVKAERRISQQIEDDSAELRCQLHFAKEELALMCKKLSRLVSEGEGMREELDKYHSAYGNVDANHPPEGQHNSAHAREAEVKVHLKLVEEEATLLSRRIVELEVENRGLRVEMSDLRETTGGRGEDEDEENRNVSEEKVVAATPDGERTERRTEMGCVYEQEAEKGQSEAETCRDGERLSLRRLSPTDQAQSVVLPGPLNEALELLREMSSFIGRVETLSTGQDLSQNPFHKDGQLWDPCTVSFVSGAVESVEGVKASEVKETRRTSSVHSDALLAARDTKMQLSLQILWILHQWCQVTGTERKDKTLSVLRRLLQDVAGELQDKRVEMDSGAKTTQDTTAESPVPGPVPGPVSGPGDAGRACSSKEKRPRRALSPRGSKRKNWSSLSPGASQLDREEPVKTWDHPIMPLNFPELDFEQMSAERSHTAPEKSAVRIYFSPPSARRVQLAQVKTSPVQDGEAEDTSSPWCTPPTSLSALCLGSSANLSDDVKEMKAGWRQAASRGGRGLDVACSATQTHVKPQMVSVGLQTDVGPQRNSSSRALSSSLVATRSHLISASLDGVMGRVERPRTSPSSPKLSRRHSGASSLHSTPSGSSSSSSSSSSRDRGLWNLNHQSGSGSSSWTRQTGHRQSAGPSPSSLSGVKPPTRPAGANRYGLVTEFLRRVSGRAEKPVSGPKTKSGPRNLERVPTRPPAAVLPRSDGVTRIVNQRFMKQRDEKSGVPDHGVRHGASVSTEDRSFDCSSGSTLTSCFARPCGSAQRQTSNQSRVLQHRHSPSF